MSSPATCRTCETLIPTETTGGMCPACLLAEAIEIGKHQDSVANTLASSASAVRLTEGEEFGNYLLLEEIARGGMGVVFKAQDQKLNRVVALKMILAGQLASDSDIQRFHREAEAAANLDHPGIVPIYDIGEHGGQHYFSMKLVEGGSLAERIGTLAGDPRGIVRLMEKVARGVHHAHQRGILHRDLKPANILIDEDGDPLITDLGLAREVGSGSDITRTGAVVGTPAYMPPEQASAKKEITTAVDIYAIGAMLYEVLTGSPPHVGDSPLETLMHVMHEEIVPPRQLNRKVDRLLERICMKCLSREPDQRYASAAALAEDLDNWLSGRTISVRRTSITSHVTEILRTNLRSAVGASLLGVMAGLLFAFCMSKVHMVRFVVENPPSEVYGALPAAIPMGRWLVFVAETKTSNAGILLGFAGWLGSMAFIGAGTAWIGRPKPGTEAVALGLIAGLFMAIALFTFHFGFNHSHVAQKETLQWLTQAAMGPAETREDARSELFRAYPGLEELSESQRGRLLSCRIIYDGLYQVPLNMIWGMLGSTLLSIVPTIVGTTFAAKLLNDPQRRWLSLGAYLELMGITIIIVFASFFQFLIPLSEGNGLFLDSIWDWGVTFVFYAFFITMAIVVFRQSLRWYWRWMMVAGFWALLIGVTILLN